MSESKPHLRHNPCECWCGVDHSRERPTTEDKLGVMVHRMTDAELRAAIEEIVGNPKNAGHRARRLKMGESLALAALMAEEARRLKVSRESVR